MHVAYDPICWNLAAEVVNNVPEVSATVVYADVAQHDSVSASKSPCICHLAGKGGDRPLRSEKLTVYYYPEVPTYTFATPFQKTFHYTQEALSHTRSLTHLKKQMDGPWFDLELIWDEHTFYEFADRSVEHTMSTMVQEPYVNHVPTVRTHINVMVPSMR
jgi:carboxymethylenebutenolidase